MKITNKGHRVKIDKKERTDGTVALQLRYWTGSNWKTATLIDRLTKNKERNEEIIQQAEAMRSQLEHNLFLSSVGNSSIFRGKTAFIKYFKEVMKNKLGMKCLTHLENFPAKNRPLRSIDKTWIEAIQAFLLSRVKSPNSAYTYFAKIKAVLNMAVKEDIIKKSPAQLVPPIKRVEKEIEYLSIEEINQISKTITRYTETKRAFLFECYTGIRLGDLRNLQFGSIDTNNNKIHFIVSKTQRPLEIPLHPIAKQLAFENFPDGIQPIDKMNVFPDLKGYNTINCQIKNIAKKAGIKKRIHFHMGRSAFATTLYQEGVPIEVISKLLGHKQITMTLQHYAKILDETKVKAISSLPMIEFGR